MQRCQCIVKLLLHESGAGFFPLALSAPQVTVLHAVHLSAFLHLTPRLFVHWWVLRRGGERVRFRGWMTKPGGLGMSEALGEMICIRLQYVSGGRMRLYCTLLCNGSGFLNTVNPTLTLSFYAEFIFFCFFFFQLWIFWNLCSESYRLKLPPVLVLHEAVNSCIKRVKSHYQIYPLHN